MHDSPSPLHPLHPPHAPSFRLDPREPRLGSGLVALALLGGCESDFPPYNELASLRVLAIASSPASPALGEVATLTPLLHVPDGEAVTSSWSWCPVAAADDGACPIGEDELARALGASAGYDLGGGPTASFEHRFAPEALARLCSGAELFERALGALDCRDGLPIQIRYVVRTPSDAVESVRRLVLRFAPEHLANENPAIEGVSALVAGAPTPLDDAATVLLPREAEVELSAALPESASENVAPRQPTNLARERLVLTWFIEAGETRYERTSFVDGALPLERATTNGWTLPSLAEHAADSARLIVVVRDDRGGVGWRAARVGLGGAP